MGLCLPLKRQQRRGGPDLCWQTVPRPRRCHWKGAVAKSYRRVGGTSSIVVSAERRWRRATNSDVGRRLSARYAGAVPCTQWYARTHNRNWIRSGTRNQWRSRSSGVVCSDTPVVVVQQLTRNSNISRYNRHFQKKTGLPKPWRDRRTDGSDGTGIQSVSPVPYASAAGPSVPSVSNSRRKLTNWFANSHKHLTWETGTANCFVVGLYVFYCMVFTCWLSVS